MPPLAGPPSGEGVYRGNFRHLRVRGHFLFFGSVPCAWLIDVPLMYLVIGVLSAEASKPYVEADLNARCVPERPNLGPPCLGSCHVDTHSEQRL